jgi:hypothetical protein
MPSGLIHSRLLEGQKKGSIGPSPAMLLPYNPNADLPQLVVDQ